MATVDIVVVGSGITGLTIAQELLKKGYRPAVVAKDFADDAQSQGFASPWAGCNWCSYADDNVREQQWDAVTYKALFKLAKERPELCEFIPFVSISTQEKPDPWFSTLVEDYKSGKGAQGGTEASYKSFVLNAPAYLLDLARRLQAAGVPFIKRRLGSIHEAYSLPELAPVSLVVNATGLGARSLLGVEDAAAMPIRGQTVLARAPGVKTCYMYTPGLPDHNTTADTKIEEPAYIIPRPGTDGHVILGGSFEPNNWSTLPDYELATRILQRTYQLCPQLASAGKSWKDIEIVAHNVGFRPARSGGARLELEALQSDVHQLAPRLPSTLSPPSNRAILHAYGLGPAGYQSSIGLATEAVDMASQWLSKNTRKAKL